MVVVVVAVVVIIVIVIVMCVEDDGDVVVQCVRCFDPYFMLPDVCLLFGNVT
jgi:hypothetical protein